MTYSCLHLNGLTLQARLVRVYIFPFFINKSHPKTKVNKELMLITSIIVSKVLQTVQNKISIANGQVSGNTSGCLRSLNISKCI